MTSIDDLDEGLAAEILATPVPMLEAELERANVRRGDPALLFPAAAAHFGVKPAPQTEPPPVERLAVVDHVLERLRQSACVMIVGASGSGKTMLLGQVLAAALRRTMFSRILVLNGTSMRFGDPIPLSRAALSALDEPFAAISSGSELRRQLAAAPLDHDASETLKRYLRKAIERDVVLSLDHVDHLVDHRGSLNWLRDFVDVTCASGGKVLLASRGTRFGGRRGQLPKGGFYSRSAELAAALAADIVYLDDFRVDELRTWLSHGFFDRFRSTGLTASALRRVCGGRPNLVMDFARYLSQQPEATSGWRALADFGRRAAQNFSVEVASLISLLRSSPRGLLDPLSAPAALHLQMVETGGVRHRTDGRLIFSSPVIGRRYRSVAKPDELLWMATSCATAPLADRPIEIIGEALRNVLREQAPRGAFSVFGQMLNRRGLEDICMYAGDRDNAKLWSQILPLKSPATWPLDDCCHTGFAIAARTGSRHFASDRMLHMPVFGSMGKVEMVVAGRVPATRSVLQDAVLVRELTHLTSATEPALASALELLSARRNLRLQRKLYHRLQSDGAGRNNPMVSAALIADCSAVAVIERGPTSWVVTSLEEIETGNEKAPAWRNMLAHSRTTALTDIATHRSGRGVVLTNPQLQEVFPGMHRQKDSFATFVYPVWSRDACRLVIYLFEGPATQDINGIKQVELSTFAPLAAIA